MKKSKAARHAIFTEAQLHQVLGHASPEVIAHIAKAADDITIDRSSPTSSIIDCETCSTLLVGDIVGFPTRLCYSALLLGEAIATRQGYRHSARLLPLGEGISVATRCACTTRLSVSLLGVLNTTALLRLSRMNNEYI
jgi:hypothetical protein